MIQRKLTPYRNQLLKLLERVRADAKAVEEKALGAAGGQADGGSSNAPMHLADLGTDTFMQEMNEALLENEQYVIAEIAAALRRIDDGSFGHCENCGTQIPDTRIGALPYARYCISCADQIRPEPALLLRSPGERLTASPRHDTRAAGTAGGGTAIGGLAGTNQEHGNPAAGNLERVTASGEFDHRDSVDAEPTSGSAGGAAGGTPAGKRSDGSKPRRVKGLHRSNRAPRPDPKSRNSGRE
jgi:RNA polymerase-binding transcription factor DksA